MMKALIEMPSPSRSSLNSDGDRAGERSVVLAALAVEPQTRCRSPSVVFGAGRLHTTVWTPGEPPSPAAAHRGTRSLSPRFFLPVLNS
jgi:hypothetical protein